MGKDFQIETFFCQLSGVGAHLLGFFGMVGYAMNGIDPPFHVIIGYGIPISSLSISISKLGLREQMTGMPNAKASTNVVRPTV